MRLGVRHGPLRLCLLGRVHDALHEVDERDAAALERLAHDLDVAQLREVEVPLLLQLPQRHAHLLHLALQVADAGRPALRRLRGS